MDSVQLRVWWDVPLTLQLEVDRDVEVCRRGLDSHVRAALDDAVRPGDAARRAVRARSPSRGPVGRPPRSIEYSRRTTVVALTRRSRASWTCTARTPREDVVDDLPGGRVGAVGVTRHLRVGGPERSAARRCPARARSAARAATAASRPRKTRVRRRFRSRPHVRPVGARDGEPDPVPRREHPRRRVDLDLEFVDLARRQRLGVRQRVAPRGVQHSLRDEVGDPVRERRRTGSRRSRSRVAVDDTWRIAPRPADDVQVLGRAGGAV